MAKNYHVENDPLAVLGGCEDLADYLEKRLTAGFELVAIVNYAGTARWIFRASSKTKAKPGASSEVG